MYFLLGISLVLASLLVLNLVNSIFAAFVWRVLAPFAENWAARSSAQIIFALRIFPLTVAVIFSTAFLLPAYLLFEPETSDEVVSYKLAFLAFVSAAGVAIAGYRVFQTWRVTHQLTTNWLAYAEPLKIDNVDVPVYRINHEFPAIAVVGTWRPRIFIAEQIFEQLSGAEIQAAMRHECGHLAARDNFKRTLLRVCSDVLLIPCGRALDRAWAENAEAAADEFAAQNGDKLTAVNLASALIKIAGIAPLNAKPTAFAAAFLISAQTGDVTWRVRRLLRLKQNDFADYQAFGLTNFYLPLIAVCCAVFAALVIEQNLHQQIHLAMEKVVAVLQ